MIYNFNHGIGWASSGVEYAQAYRAGVLRRLGYDARFIFTDMITNENIEHLTANIGFEDAEVIWLYTFFTDIRIAPTTYTVAQLEETFAKKPVTVKRDVKTIRYNFEGSNNFYMVYLTKPGTDLVHCVEMVANGCLIRKDFYTYCKVFTEYYAPLDGKAHLYQRRFFNEDGTTAYDEITDGDSVMYKFPDKLLGSKQELVAYMVERLDFTENDTVIIDRTEDIAQPVLQNKGRSRVGVVIHADHFSEGNTDEDYILWNNYYEYDFSMYKHLDFYISSTDAQNRLVREQFKQYVGAEPNVVTIPVGSNDELRHPSSQRKVHSLITASRLAAEKHVDWLIEAVAEAKKQVPDVSLDIYGKGVEEDKLKDLIKKFSLQDSVRLMGQYDLTEVYKDYEVYLSGSTSEGFGLTLMEAMGSGVPIIGFDVRYGNQTFIEDGRTGYLIPVHDEMDKAERVKELSDRIVRIFTEADLESMHEYSYEMGAKYLTKEVEKKWTELLCF